MNIELATMQDLFNEIAKRSRAQQGIFCGISTVPMEGRPFDMATTTAHVIGPLEKCLTMSSYLVRAILCRAAEAGMSPEEMAAHSYAANQISIPGFHEDGSPDKGEDK